MEKKKRKSKLKQKQKQKQSQSVKVIVNVAKPKTRRRRRRQPKPSPEAGLGAMPSSISLPPVVYQAAPPLTFYAQPEPMKQQALVGVREKPKEWEIISQKETILENPIENIEFIKPVKAETLAEKKTPINVMEEIQRKEPEPAGLFSRGKESRIPRVSRPSLSASEETGETVGKRVSLRREKQKELEQERYSNLLEFKSGVKPSKSVKSGATTIATEQII